MIIRVTAREMLDKYDWDKFCDIVGLNVWAINEGMDDTETFDLTEEQALELGVINPKGIIREY